MTFSFQAVQDEAEKIEAKLATEIGHDREERILQAVKDAIEKLAREIGGYVSVSGNGHVNADEGQPGDTVNLQVNSLLRPSDPSPDAGLAAAAGSAQSFPPESSTAAPQPADGSAPAAQEAIPQPAILAPAGNETPPGEPGPTVTSPEQIEQTGVVDPEPPVIVEHSDPGPEVQVVSPHADEVELMAQDVPAAASGEAASAIDLTQSGEPRAVLDAAGQPGDGAPVVEESSAPEQESAQSESPAN